MTRQTPASVAHLTLGATNRPLDSLVSLVERGRLDLNPEYQRASAWSDDQRVALVLSWLRGLPTGVIIINDRAPGVWTAGFSANRPSYAVIDGKQRLETAVAWFRDGFAVPASWFDAGAVVRSEDTTDGPYVRFSGLSDRWQRFFEMTVALPCSEAKVSTIQAEAEIYLLVNGGGTPQTDADMANARRIAEN